MYDNTNTGILARNSDRQSDKAPEFKGSINIDGTEYWLSAWVNVGKNGKLAGQKYFSIKASPKDATPKQAKQDSGFDDLDDGIPF